MRKKNGSRSKVHFPFPKAETVPVQKAVPPAKALIVSKQEQMMGDVYQTAEKSVGGADQSVVFRVSTQSDSFRDERMFGYERTKDGWRVVMAWQAEGTGDPPAIVRTAAMFPELFNAGVNGLLGLSGWMKDSLRGLQNDLFHLNEDPLEEGEMPLEDEDGNGQE